jgi:hypothetical protein
MGWSQQLKRLQGRERNVLRNFDDQEDLISSQADSEVHLGAGVQNINTLNVHKTSNAKAFPEYRSDGRSCADASLRSWRISAARACLQGGKLHTTMLMAMEFI